MRANIAILLIILGISSSNIYAQSEDVRNYNSVNYHLYKIPLLPKELKKISIEGNNGKLNTAQYLTDFGTNNSNNFFACNACIETGPDYRPQGLYIRGGKIIQDVDLTDGNGNQGNFYTLKPNGVIYGDGNGVQIMNSFDYQYNKNIDWAIQSGPLLVENGMIHSMFDPNSTNYRHRVGVGISSLSNELIFAISESEVNFYSFAEFFEDGLGCQNALCLESGRPFVHMPSGSTVNPYPDLIGQMIIYNQDPIVNRPQPNNPNPTPKPQTPKCTVKMIKSASGVYEIPAEVNGALKISFIFDTGASDVSISPDVAMVLFRNGTIKKSDYIGSVPYTFADGSTSDCSVFNLNSIKIGNRTFTNVRASISNSISAPLLLGQSVIQRMGSYSIDNNSHELLIY